MNRVQLAASKAPPLISDMQGNLAELFSRSVSDPKAKAVLDEVGKLLAPYAPPDAEEAVALRSLTASERRAVESTPGATAVGFIRVRDARGPRPASRKGGAR